MYGSLCTILNLVNNKYFVLKISILYLFIFKSLFRVNLFRDFLQKCDKREMKGTQTLGGLQYNSSSIQSP